MPRHVPQGQILASGRLFGAGFRPPGSASNFRGSEQAAVRTGRIRWTAEGLAVNQPAHWRRRSNAGGIQSAFNTRDRWQEGLARDLIVLAGCAGVEQVRKTPHA